MEEAAAELRFEDAAHHRDVLQVLKNLADQQEIDNSSGKGDYDLIAIAAAEELAVVQLFFVRNGTVISRANYRLSRGMGEDESILLRHFLQEYYGGGDRIPSKLLVDRLPEDAPLLAEAFSAQTGHKVQIIVPQRGDKLRLLKLVKENARAILTNYLNAKDRQEERNAAALEKLRHILGLDVTPARIECYDISHIQGTDMVSGRIQ